MNGRFPLVVAAILSMSAVGLAGCIEAPAFLSADQTEVSALANRGIADDAARAWNPSAELVGVFTAEDPEADGNESLQADPDVGNGLAVVWYYTYLAPTQAAGSDEDANATMQDLPVRVYKVYADGTLIEEDPEQMEQEWDADLETRPLVNWTVDSDAALATARGNATFAAVYEGANLTVFEGVSHEEETGTVLYAAATSTAGIVVAIVDADEGTLVSVMDFANFAMPAWDWEGFGAPVLEMHEEGRVDPSENVMEYPFHVAADDQAASFEIDVSPDAPMDALHWSVVGEDGETLEEGHIGAPQNWDDGDSREFELDEGDYTLVVSYMTDAPLPLVSSGVDYEFDLVIGGWDFDFDFDW